MSWTCDQIDWSALAAWVQAVGSVAAILAAIVISRQESRRSGAARQKEKVTVIADRLWTATAYVREGEQILAEALESITDAAGRGSYFRSTYPAWFIEHVRGQLAAFPILDTGNGAFAAAYLRCVRGFSSACGLLAELSANPHNRYFDDTVAELNELARGLNDARAALISEIHVVESYKMWRDPDETGGGWVVNAWRAATGRTMALITRARAGR